MMPTYQPVHRAMPSKRADAAWRVEDMQILEVCTSGRGGRTNRARWPKVTVVRVERGDD